MSEANQKIHDELIGSQEELEQIVYAQGADEREREKEILGKAAEDAHTEKIIRSMESQELAHQNEGTDPIE